MVEKGWEGRGGGMGPHFLGQVCAPAMSTRENTESVHELVLSQEGQPGTH